MKILRNIFQILLILIVAFYISLFSKTGVKLFDADILIAYIGILIGFAITIYTFSLSLIPQIKDLMVRDKKITTEKREKYIKGLLVGFQELKEDVKLISYCLYASIVVVMCQGINLNYTHAIKIQDNGFALTFDLISFFKISFFLLATRSFIDLINSLLTMSGIYTELIKHADN